MLPTTSVPRTRCISLNLHWDFRTRNQGIGPGMLNGHRSMIRPWAHLAIFTEICVDCDGAKMLL